MTIVRTPVMRSTEDTARRIVRWEEFLRDQNAHFASLAASRGEPYTPLANEEIAVAARLIAEGGLPPPFVA